MTKILVACGNGVGSSLMVKMKVEKVMGGLGLPCEVTHSSVGQSKSDAGTFDVVVVSHMFVPEFEGVAGVKVVGLTNILSEDEIQEKLSDVLHV